ncbi:MAG: hypothetical protein HYY50_04270 [Candidatus Kerfeldbacteria bacterium]|nr:hypothetical protein [Candidatus Kerfeldbacteria bacterium]
MRRSRTKQSSHVSIISPGAVGATLLALAAIVTVVVFRQTSSTQQIRSSARSEDRAFRVTEQPTIAISSNALQPRLLRASTGPWKIDDVTLVSPDDSILQQAFTEEVRRRGRDADTVLRFSTAGLRPGRYTARVQFRAPNGKTMVVNRTFFWGVIGVNVRRSIIRPDTTTEIGMTVLDDTGHTQCSAGVELVVTDPAGRNQRFSTSDGTIRPDPECVDKGVTINPDYAASYRAGQSGIYRLRVTATNINGTRSIDDFFEVRDTVPFDIERTTFPTRVFPVVDYNVKLTITANSNYRGTVRERVPSDFILKSVSDEGAVQPVSDLEQEIAWNVDWRTGETHEFEYTIDFPDIAPALYLLGPLALGEFSESRPWQVALDSVGGSASGSRLTTIGFELQSLSAGMEITATNGLPAINTSPSYVRSGAASLRTQVTSSAAVENIRYRYAAANLPDDIYVRTFIRITTAPSAQTLIVAFVNSAPSTKASIRLNTNLTLDLRNEEDGILIGSSSPLLLNTWYRLEMRFDSTDGAGLNDELEARLDGASFASRLDQDFTSGALDLYFGYYTTGVTGDMYFDDIAINDDSGGNDQNWPGEGKVVHLLPNGNVSNTCTGGSTAWDIINEVTPIDDELDSAECTTGDIITVDVQNASTWSIVDGDQVKLAQVGVRYSHGDTPLTQYGLRINIPGTNALEEYISPGESVPGWTTNAVSNPKNYRLTLFNQSGSADGDPITKTDIDSARIGLRDITSSEDTFVTTLWLVVEYVPAEGGRLWTSGFELQSETSGVEFQTVYGISLINTTTKHSGAASMRINGLTLLDRKGIGHDFEAANNDGPFYARMYLYVVSPPTGLQDSMIMHFQDSSGTWQAGITIRPTGLLDLWDQVGTIGTSGVLSTNRWYFIEMKLDTRGSGSTDIVEARIDGTVFATSSTRNIANGVMNLAVGGNTGFNGGQGGDWYIDDVAVNKGIGATQNGYPGPGSVVHLRPNAPPGDFSQWTNQGGCTANWDCTSEITPNDGTGGHYMAASSLNATADVNVTDTAGVIPAGALVNLTQVGIRFTNTTSTQADLVVRLKDSANAPAIEGDTEAITSTAWVTNDTSIPSLYSITAYDRPFTSSAWTPSVLDNTQIGVRLTRGGSILAVTTMWLLVEYVPAAPPTMNISGTCNAFDQTTACADVGTIAVAVNDTLQSQNQPTVAGSWSIASVPAPASGAVVTVFIDISTGLTTDRAVAVTKYDGSGDITGVTLYKEHLTIGSDDNQSLSSSNLGSYDDSVSPDADVFHDVDVSNNLIVDNNGSSAREELYIRAGNTYTLNGNVTTFALEVDGTLDADTYVLTIEGNGTPFVIDGSLTTPGVFDSVFSTVVYSHATGATVAPTTYSHLWTGSGGTYSLTASQDDFERAGPGLGTGWTDNVQGDPQIYSSSDLGGALAGDNTATWASPVGADQYSEAVIAAASPGNEAQVCVRVSSDGLDRYCYTTDTTAGPTDVYRWLGGAYQTLDPGPGDTIPAATVGDTIKLEVIGITLKLYINNELKFQTTDSSIASGLPGIVVFGNGAAPTSQIESWQGGAVLAALDGVTIADPLGTLALNDYDLTAGTEIVTFGTLTQNANRVTTLTGAPSSIRGSGASTFGNLHIGKADESSTINVTQNFTVQSKLWINQSSGTNTFNASSYTITLSGSGQPFNIGAGEVFTPSSSTIRYTGTTATNITATTYYNLELRPTSGNPTYTFDTGTVRTISDLTAGGANPVTVTAATNNTAVDVDGDVVIGNGSTLTAPPTASLTVGENWFNSGTFNEGTATLTFDGATPTVLNTGCGDADSCSTSDFASVTISKAQPTTAVSVGIGSELRVNGILNITQGELQQGAGDIRVDGSPNAVTIGANGKWANTSIGDIMLGGIFDVASGGLLTLDVGGNSDGCSDSDDITLTTTDTGQPARSISGTGTFTLYDVTVSYMNATVPITVNGGTNVPGTNQGSWTFNACPGGTIYGTLTSAVFDTQVTDGAAYNSVMWQGAAGTGTVRFQLATSNCPNGKTNPPACDDAGTWNFCAVSSGPTCVSTDWYNAPSPNTPVTLSYSEHNNYRYFRYKIQLCSNDCTSSGSNYPRVDDIIVNWSP